MLPNYATGAEIANEEFEKIGLSGVFRHWTAIDLSPDLSSRATRMTVDRSYDGEVHLVILVDPLDEQPDQIVIRERSSRRVTQEPAHVVSLLARVGTVPNAECLAHQG